MRARAIFLVPALWCLATPSLAASPTGAGLCTPQPHLTKLVLIGGHFAIDDSAQTLDHLIPAQSR
jgi:hypothetical protein